MLLILVLLLLTYMLEIMLWLPQIWKLRNLLAGFLLLADICLPVILFLVHPAIWTIAVLFIGVYRSMNMLRIIKNRLQANYLYQASRRTSINLIVLQIACTAVARLGYILGIDGFTWQQLLAVLDLVGAALLLQNLNRQRHKSLPPNISLKASDLPSLTVAIPARNETSDLEACLQGLLASTYKKLEIIVLDDCSQNRRTSEIIQKYAHDGVRFVAGKQPPKHWLPRNYACKQLAEQANSDLILFCGVDIRFEPQSLDFIVSSMLEKNKTMVSLVPKNIVLPHGSYLSFLVQPARYGWEFLLPRRFIGRPAVLSSCWLITRQMLDAAGGFEAAAQNIVPERQFARSAIEHHDGYSFILSNTEMGLTSVKVYGEQFSTAVRSRYPQLHRRPEMVAIYTIMASILIIGPYKLLIIALSTQLWPLVLLSASTCILLGLVGFDLLRVTYRKSFIWGLFGMPFIIIYDIVLLNYSMWQYEFNEVIWKGRNVCMPVMQVYKRLPPIEP